MNAPLQGLFMSLIRVMLRSPQAHVMSHRIIPLKSRVRYDGRVRTFDRRATKGADLEKLPDPIWRMITLTLQSKFKKQITDASATSHAEQDK